MTVPYSNENKINPAQLHLADKITEDRAAVTAALAQGKSLEEASAPYITEEAFEEWYQSFCDALNQAVAG